MQLVGQSMKRQGHETADVVWFIAQQMLNCG
jgi:hypothetical protein